MNSDIETLDLVLEPADNPRLANLCGPLNEHLKQIESRLGVEINYYGNAFNIIGAKSAIHATAEILKEMYQAAQKEVLSPSAVHLFLQDARVSKLGKDGADISSECIYLQKGLVKAHGINQTNYISNIKNCDLVFGIGPAGTGKTYLAVACAAEALERERIRRVVLVRPAVEAGERLGFLPGDLAQKIDPYLRPMYDALYEMLGFEKVSKYVDRNIIEIAPLAYMRGRTLNDAFIILDEAQNTTVEQMKMFLTRIGFGSQAVVTGDITQIDLPTNKQSGLRHVMHVLKNVKGIRFNLFTSKDVVRHALVQRIIEAYEKHETSTDDK